jgi:hypothetical protein
MTAQRLVPERYVTEAEQQLRAAVGRALDRQLQAMNTRLREHGQGSLTAASHKNQATAMATGAVAVPNLWNPDQWQDNVQSEVAPVAAAVVVGILGAALAGMSLHSLWGGRDTSQQTADAITARAEGLGAGIGDRVNAAAMDSPEGVVVGVNAELASAAGILGDGVGAMAETAATMATNDVANSVLALDAPAYLSASKTWNNQGDDRVRETHQDVADVAINEYFDVGGGMVGPGDPQGPDEEVINCRCWMTVDGLVPEGSDYTLPGALESLPGYSAVNPLEGEGEE